MRLHLVNYGLQNAADTQLQKFSKHIPRFDCTPHHLAFSARQLTKICNFFFRRVFVSLQNELAEYCLHTNTLTRHECIKLFLLKLNSPFNGS